MITKSMAAKNLLLNQTCENCGHKYDSIEVKSDSDEIKYKNRCDRYCYQGRCSKWKNDDWIVQAVKELSCETI